MVAPHAKVNARSNAGKTSILNGFTSRVWLTLLVDQLGECTGPRLAGHIRCYVPTYVGQVVKQTTEFPSKNLCCMNRPIPLASQFCLCHASKRIILGCAMSLTVPELLRRWEAEGNSLSRIPAKE